MPNALLTGDYNDEELAQEWARALAESFDPLIVAA